MKLAKQILEKALEIISVDRRADYGDAIDSFNSIAELWTWYINTKHKVKITVTGKDVAMMMDLLKTSRETTGAPKEDNLIDKCGYAALAALFQKEKPKLSDTFPAANLPIPSASPEETEKFSLVETDELCYLPSLEFQAYCSISAIKERLMNYAHKEKLFRFSHKEIEQLSRAGRKVYSIVFSFKSNELDASTDGYLFLANSEGFFIPFSKGVGIGSPVNIEKITEITIHNKELIV